MNLQTKASQAISTQSKNDSNIFDYNLPLDSMELVISHINGSYPE